MDANQTYHDARERTKRQLRQIEALLDARAERQAKAPTNWGYVGDIHSVVRELGEVIESMGGAEPAAATEAAKR
jgi:hypothetical protein